VFNGDCVMATKKGEFEAAAGMQTFTEDAGAVANAS
jgi:hypothetical protein